MAKSQKHGNREAKKPKKIKETVATPAASAKGTVVLLGSSKKKG